MTDTRYTSGLIHGAFIGFLLGAVTVVVMHWGVGCQT